MLFSAAANATEISSDIHDQKQVSITVYNQNLALVRDKRSIKLAHGEISLALHDVSARIQPETALLRSLSHPDSLNLIEQNFDFDLLTPAKLLEKFVGEKVGVVKTHPTTGEEIQIGATVLSTNGGVVLKMADGTVETGVPGRIVFRKIPEQLRDKPTLVVKLDSNKALTQELELSYLSGGLSWKADYVAALDTAEKTVDLHGWITLTNASGTEFHDAAIQVVAGNVNRVRREMALPMMTSQRAQLDQESSPEQENLLDYHLYTLPRRTTLANNQTKQIAFMRADDVPVARSYRLRGTAFAYQQRMPQPEQPEPVDTWLKFTNSEKNHLGTPFPGGVVRVYKNDSQGNTQFIGEDHIAHTAVEQPIELKLGTAFDITAKRTQTEFRKIAGSSQYNYVFEIGFAIGISNARNEDVTVIVEEPFPGDWEILESSEARDKTTSHLARWNLGVEAKGDKMLRYRVRIKF